MKKKVTNQIHTILAVITLCVMGLWMGTTITLAHAADWVRQPTNVPNQYIQYAPQNIQDILKETWAGGLVTDRMQYIKPDPTNKLYQYYWATGVYANDMLGNNNPTADILTEWQGGKDHYNPVPPPPDGYAEYCKEVNKEADAKGYAPAVEPTPLINELSEPPPISLGTKIGGGVFAMGGMLLFLAFSIGFYFAPTIVAIFRKVPQLATVAIINLVFGWTIIGWVVALCFALWAYKKPTQATA